MAWPDDDVEKLRNVPVQFLPLSVFLIVRDSPRSLYFVATVFQRKVRIMNVL